MATKLRLVFTITIVFLSFYSYAQTDYWQQEVSQKLLDEKFSNRFEIHKGKEFSFDEKAFKKELNGLSKARKNSKIVYFPNEQGRLIAFKVFESPVFSEGLAQKYPDIKSYKGYAVENRNSRIRFSVSHKGIQSMLVNPEKEGTTFLQKISGSNYVLYTRNSSSKHEANFLCQTKSSVAKTSKDSKNFNDAKGASGTTAKVDDQILRTVRLAVSASGAYTTEHGGTIADALAAINATVTRINEVFENDLAIHLELVANNDQVIYTNENTDPYTNSLSSQTQAALDNEIGAANYDVGILFNKAAQGDGNAGAIGSVCSDGIKGSAYASHPNPEGDLYDLDYVAHEMGHQFGANHTWSFESEGTGVQVEPASGTTIMGYAGIVAGDNVASNGDDYFHYASIVQITDFIKTVSCVQTSSLINSPPVVSPVNDYSIPISTAFVLTGAATDTDTSDVLTFTWEQMDDGVVSQSDFGPDNVFGANFRSQRPSVDPQRYFPKLSRVIDGQLTQDSPSENSDWETVSDVEREFNFAFTVRDNAEGGGQVVSELVKVHVENNGGAFAVTSQSTNVVVTAGDVQEVTWNVVNTNLAPINTQTVDILLSTDGGQTFSVMLAENVANDGSHNVQIPGEASTQARIMVKANGNIFFAVNASDFTIEASSLVLAFDELENNVCKGDTWEIPFTYNTYNGFNETASFSLENVPTGVNVSFSPETATANATAVNITFSNTAGLNSQVYPITVVANTASLVKEMEITLHVFDSNFSANTLLSPVDGTVDALSNVPLVWEEDDGASSYVLQIARDIDFSDIIETSTLVSNTYVPQNLENETQYYWRVKSKNNCGEGVFAAPFAFTTLAVNCVNLVSTDDFPIVITTSGAPTVFAELNIDNDLPVADIKVNLELSHNYLADLTVSLTSPSGTSVLLFRNACGAAKNVNATFDDEASDLVCSGDPAISGTVKPASLLSAFDGESSLGVWKLTVADGAAEDGGAVMAFSIDMCTEGAFRPDADNDGVFDDGPDLCLGTPEGAVVDSSGCRVLIFPNQNFRLKVQSESCSSSNDGTVVVDVQEALDYSITTTGNGVNLTDTFNASSYTINDLMAGTYMVCFNAVEGGLNYREQCFQVIITEPGDLNVSGETSLEGNIVELDLQGADLYTIELNGVAVQTQESKAVLTLKEGSNSVKVTTELECQGIYEAQFFYTTSPVVYPNPFTETVQISFKSNDVGEVRVRLLSAQGGVIKTESYLVTGSVLELNLSGLSDGTYFLKFEGKDIKGTTKIIKK